MFSAISEYASHAYVVSPQLLKLFTLYTFYSCIHSLAATLYSKYCANFSWRRILLNPLLTITPQCKGLQWLMNSTNDGITSWFLTITTWAITNMNWITGAKRASCCD